MDTKMENLLEAFANTQVTFQPNNTAAEHPLYSLYKSKPSQSSQKARRAKFLEAQKSKRLDFHNLARNLATNNWNDYDDQAQPAEDEDETMYWENVPKKPPRYYKDQLMMSEWLVEVPEDLETNWSLVLCPVGKRCLVVASQGVTKVYAKNGYKLKSFASNLPGGSKVQIEQEATKSGNYTILDCIFNELEKSFYILDLMCWNGHPCFDSETEFRFFWLESKCNEHPELQEISSYNKYKFIRLPYFKCDKESIQSCLWSSLPFSIKLDGLLFYHKQTHYHRGITPLVVWLKAFMLPEMLNIDVPDSLKADKPANYRTMQEYVPKAFAKNEKRKQEEANHMLVED